MSVTNDDWVSAKARYDLYPRVLAPNGTEWDYFIDFHGESPSVRPESNSTNLMPGVTLYAAKGQSFVEHPALLCGA